MLRVSLRLTLAVVLGAAALGAQPAITTPEQALGHQVGADGFLADYDQLVAYWRTLEKESDRLKVETIGTTSYGQPMLMAVISSKANLARLDDLRDVSERLTRAEGLDDAQARALVDDGCAVVWIDAGIHATEAVAAQNILELVYRMCVRDDDEVQRILDSVVLLVCPANPDGMQMVAKGYMATGHVGRLPVLYQRWVGHDNNRDFYMANLPETAAIDRVLYRRWYPQIVYDHHQSSPHGTVIFTPPFRDPFNYRVDPRVIRGIELVASHMNSRFAWEGKAGVVSRSGAPYSTWWNGGLRTTAYFHNMIGILTEVFGSPDPTRLEPALDQRLPSSDYPMPIAGEMWHARQTIEYLQTANFAVLDLAARYRKELLWNAYAMGRDAIACGGEDHWTATPRLLAEARRRETSARSPASETDDGGENGGAPVKVSPFADPGLRDPRAYVLPADQPDFAAATRLVAALCKTGVEVQRATADFEIGAVTYPKDSYVVWTAQAFRAQVLDMFEPQWHPTDVDAAGDPMRPYDSAGWTPALTMDVRFDRILDGFEAPLEPLETPRVPPATVAPAAAGWLCSHADSNVTIATNRLLALGESVAWLEEPCDVGGERQPAGTVFVARGERTQARLEASARELGVHFTPVASAPDVAMRALQSPRIGVFDVYGGSSAVGWTEWLLQQFEFPFEPVFGKRIQEGDLRRDFDVLLFQTGLPDPKSDIGAGGWPSQIPLGDLQKLIAALPPFEDWSRAEDRLVRIDGDKGIPALRRFVEDGGVLCVFGQQVARLSQWLDLPIDTGVHVAGRARPATGNEFFVPTSVLRAFVDDEQPLGYGVSPQLAMVYDGGPVLTPRPDAAAAAVHVVASWADGDLLLSGWAIGEHLMANKGAVIDVDFGKGKVYLFGADVVYRGQPQGSFKLLWNALLAR